MKKILIIVFAVIVVGIGIYAFFFSGSSVPSPVAGGTGSLPSVGSPQGIPSFFGGAKSATGTTAGQLSLVADNPVISYFVNPDRSVLLVQPDGKIFDLFNNQSSTLNSIPVKDLLSAGFSYDGTKIVISFGNQSNPQSAVFDISSKSWTSLSGGVQSPQWSLTDQRLAYIRDNGNGTETLFSSDFSATKPVATTLGTFHVQDMAISWVGQNQIVLYDRPSAYTSGSELLFDLKKKTLSLVVSGRTGLETAWSDATTSMGLSFSSAKVNRGGRLQLIDLAGNALQNISFVTFPSKCVFGNAVSPLASSSIATSGVVLASSSTPTSTLGLKTGAKLASSSLVVATSTSYLAFYCGVPRDQNSLNYYYLPDDYEQGTIFTADDIYRVNTTNGHIDTLWGDSGESLDISNVKMFDGMLFFVNRYNQKLYSLSL